MGSLNLYLIYSYDGVWEESWRDIQGLLEIPVISKTDMDHALKGWSRPLMEALGPPPEGQLRLLPKSARECSRRKDCPFYIKRNCTLLSKTLPWCFEPEGFDKAQRVSEVLQLWRQEVYVLVVEEALNV